MKGCITFEVVDFQDGWLGTTFIQNLFWFIFVLDWDIDFKHFSLYSESYHKRPEITEITEKYLKSPNLLNKVMGSKGIVRQA